MKERNLRVYLTSCVFCCLLLMKRYKHGALWNFWFTIIRLSEASDFSYSDYILGVYDYFARLSDYLPEFYDYRAVWLGLWWLSPDVWWLYSHIWWLSDGSWWLSGSWRAQIRRVMMISWKLMIIGFLEGPNQACDDVRAPNSFRTIMSTNLRWGSVRAP